MVSLLLMLLLYSLGCDLEFRDKDGGERVARTEKSKRPLSEALHPEESGSLGPGSEGRMDEELQIVNVWLHYRCLCVCEDFNP